MEQTFLSFLKYVKYEINSNVKLNQLITSNKAFKSKHITDKSINKRLSIVFLTGAPHCFCLTFTDEQWVNYFSNNEHFDKEHFKVN
jgi:hypothetical protein